MLRMSLKICMLAAIGSVLATSAAGAAQPLQAATPEASYRTEHDHKHEKHRDHGHDQWEKADREKHQARRLKHLQEAAKYFGISTEGKSAHDLHVELKAIRKSDPAKWEKFKEERKAKREAMLFEEAKKLGISTEGKTKKQIYAEIAKKRKLNEAKPN